MRAGQGARASLVALVGVALATLAGAPRAPAAAETPAPRAARFAIVIGVNDPATPDLPPLRYADDDAARTFDLFRGLGAAVRLLARPDENTRRLHPQAAAEAAPPTPAGLAAAVGETAADVWLARERGVATELYVVYAGHGAVDGEGAAGLTLEGGRLTADGLTELVDGVRADRTHVIVDACDAWAFAYAGARGPGGERREVHGFSRGALAYRPDTGLLLGASATRETHEWEAVQAGVFSHVVRSGLYGAADADGDGRVDYREIAAFVDRAGAAIPNERYRPAVHVRPPAGDGVLLDLQDALGRRVELDGGAATHGRFVVEDGLGVRLADFHNAPGQPVQLVRPPGAGLVYLRDGAGTREWTLPAAPAVVRIGELTPVAPRTGARGAAHVAFQQLFALPFDRAVVDAWVPERWEPPAAPPGPDRLSLGYELRNGTLAGSELVHGLRLGYERVLGRWRPRVGLGYAVSRYRFEQALDVTAHEVSLAGGLDLLLWGSPAWELLAGVEAGGGWTVQTAGGETGYQRRSGGLFRWRGGLALSWAPAPEVALVFRALAGQVVLDAETGARAPFEAAVGAAVEWRP